MKQPRAPAPRACISPSSADGKSRDQGEEHAVVADRSAPEEVSNLVERARRGDSDAFGQLYCLHYGRIFRLARFYLPLASAEDAVAETFLRAWKGLPRYRDTGAPLVAWLYGIARHVVSDMRRAGWRTEPRPVVENASVDPWAGREDLLALGSALVRLPKEQRRVIELKFLLGLTNEEVATLLGKSAGAVNTQQWRALRTLRRLLEGK